MPRLTEEALAATRTLARSLLAEALGLSPTSVPSEPAIANDRRRQWGPQTIVQAAEAFLQREGHFPAYGHWKQAKRWGLPAFDTVRRHWGSCAELHQAVRLRQRLRQALTTSDEENTL